MSEQEVKQLREELRNGRTKADGQSGESLNGSSINFEGFGGGDDREEQSVSPYLHGSNSENDAAHGPYHDSERSANEITERIRSTNRRSSKNSGSPSNDSETPRGATRRTRGKLVADDPIPLRIKTSKSTSKSSNARAGLGSTSVKTEPTEEKESKSVQRGKTASKVGAPVSERESEEQGFKLKLPKFKEGTTLTIAEAKALEEPLLSALADDFGYIDQYLWYRTQDVTQAPIWSDMDNEDLKVLVSVLLQRGQKSPATASVIRTIIKGSTYVDVGMLMVPRFMKTVQVLQNAPKRERVSLLDRKRAARGL